MEKSIQALRRIARQLRQGGSWDLLHKADELCWKLAIAGRLGRGADELLRVEVAKQYAAGCDPLHAGFFAALEANWAPYRIAGYVAHVDADGDGQRRRWAELIERMCSHALWEKPEAARPRSGTDPDTLRSMIEWISRTEQPVTALSLAAAVELRSADGIRGRYYPVLKQAGYKIDRLGVHPKGCKCAKCSAT